MPWSIGREPRNLDRDLLTQCTGFTFDLVERGIANFIEYHSHGIRYLFQHRSRNDCNDEEDDDEERPR